MIDGREILGVLAAFLCGTVPFGLILVRLTTGRDVRDVGSGNIGATNALRAAGKFVGVSVLVLDGLKGAAGIALGRAIALPGDTPGSAWLAGALIFAPVAGHVFTPWLRFKGGKGVATALGVLAVADARVLLVAGIAFLAAAIPSRIVSAGSVAAAIAALASGFAFYGTASPAWGYAGAALLVLWRHRENIRRIARGEESRIGARSRAPAP